MPLNKNSLGEPPQVMTWSKASPVLIVASVFWLLRVMFEMFWFFGPALSALACTVSANGTLNVDTSSVVGETVATACTGVAAVAGFFGAPEIEAFGVMMAMIVGFIGWLSVGFMVLFTNRRVFTEDPKAAIWFTGGFLVAELPIIGSLPGLLTATFRTYHQQIKRDKEVLREHQQQMAAARQQEQQQQLARAAQIQQAQVYQADQEQEAVNDELYGQESREAANDDSYTQEYKEAA